MKLGEACLDAVRALSLLLAMGVSVQAQAPSLASSEQVERTAVVRDVQVRDGTVSGTIVNHSPRLLRDVRLIVRHSWHWRNERHPGEDNPGRSEDFTAPGEVPPSGTLPFTFQLPQPLPERSDGHFVTTGDVIGFTEVGN